MNYIKYFASTILVFALIIFNSCKNEEESPGIVGTWQMDKIQARVNTNVDSITKMVEDFILQKNDHFQDARFTFESGNKCTIQYTDSNKTTTYGYINKVLSIGNETFTVSIFDTYLVANKYYDNMIDSAFIHDVLQVVDTANHIQIIEASCIYTCNKK